MGLIKKSVSDTERKNRYARYAMRVFKDCHVLNEWKAYMETSEYKRFKQNYIRDEGTTDAWYDCELCADILGSCNFTDYLKCEYGNKFPIYNMFLAYLWIFDREELDKYTKKFRFFSHPAQTFDRTLYSCNQKARRIVNKWLKIGVNNGNITEEEYQKIMLCK